jgi:hypothetical protein
LKIPATLGVALSPTKHQDPILPDLNRNLQTCSAISTGPARLRGAHLRSASSSSIQGLKKETQGSSRDRVRKFFHHSYNLKNFLAGRVCVYWAAARYDKDWGSKTTSEWTAGRHILFLNFIFNTFGMVWWR